MVSLFPSGRAATLQMPLYLSLLRNYSPNAVGLFFFNLTEVIDFKITSSLSWKLEYTLHGPKQIKTICLCYSGSWATGAKVGGAGGTMGLGVCVRVVWKARLRSLTGTVWFSGSPIRAPASPRNGPTQASWHTQPLVGSRLEVRPWDGVAKVMGSTSSCQRYESYVFMAATAMKMTKWH